MQQNIILSESEEQVRVSLVKHVFKDEAALSEKREDRVDHLYNDDGVGVLPVQVQFVRLDRVLMKLSK